MTGKSTKNFTIAIGLTRAVEAVERAPQSQGASKGKASPNSKTFIKVENSLQQKK